jgi:hypothetical protein
MSYSRWSNSCWYTYWCCPENGDGFNENRNNAIFEICGCARFTAKELRDDIDACMAKVIAQVLANKHSNIRQFKTHQTVLIEELKGYVAEFLAEVDLEYPSYVER